MTERAPTLTRYDLEAKIVKRCWQDAAFRKEFTADPVATVVKYLQVPAADLPKIVVHEEPAGSWHIVLPEKPANAGELSEEDLEKIAGGTTLFCVVVTVTGFVSSGLGVSVTYTAATAINDAINKGW